MLRFFTLFTFLTLGLNAQQTISTSIAAEVAGGKEAFEQVLQTQINLPKVLLTKSFEQEITVYFELDSLNHAKALTYKGTLNNVLRKEIARILRFLTFVRQTAVSETPYEYYLTFTLSTDKYNKYIKQRTRSFIPQKAADSSFVVYGKADKSPEYFKKGEEGLQEFVMSELEYPAVAKEKSIEGTAVIEFIVETNGFVTNLKAKQGVSAGGSEEAIRVLSKTKWIPAEVNGKYVRYKMTYPITFSLRNNFKDNGSYRQGAY